MMENFKSARHLYARGWLGLIPLVGGFVGLGLIVLGIFKYRDKKLILIGTTALLFTVIIYSSLFYYFQYSEAGAKEFAKTTPALLNNVVKDIEFYKLQNGSYPDSLEQLLPNDKFVMIHDVLSSRGFSRTTAKFNYKKIGSKYLLYSSGIDRVPNTKDDIYPAISMRDSSKIGLIIH